MTEDLCPNCGGGMFYRRYNTPVDGIVKVTIAHGCKNCHTATLEEIP